MWNDILLPQLFQAIMRKKCSSDREKVLKFKAEGQEFAKYFRSPEHFIQTVKTQTNFYTECFFNLFLWTIRIKIGENNWDLETYMKSLKKVIRQID